MKSNIEVQKEKLKAIVLECYKKSYAKNFNGLNVSKLSSQTLIGKIKCSIEVFDKLDENSQTYKSLLSVARKAAEELNNESYVEWYRILIEQFVTLPEEIKNKKSKKVIFFPDKKIIEDKKEEQKITVNITEEKIIPVGITGVKLKKIIAEEKDFNSELEDMSFEDDYDFELEDESTEDLNELNL